MAMATTRPRYMVKSISAAAALGQRFIGTLGRNSKTPVEPGQELLQHGPGLLKGGCSREPQFRDQPVLEGSGRPLDSALGLGRRGEYHLNPQFLHCPSELGGRAAGLIFRLVLEDRAPVGVQGEGYAGALEHSLHQPEIAVGIFMLAEQGVVHREQYSELRSVISQPPVIAAVQLDQHTLPGHPLPAHLVFGGHLRRGLLIPAFTRIRRRVVLPMTIPSRSASNSLRWEWLAPAYVVRAR